MHLERQLRQAQKMEAMGRLAGGISHDFNNLLSVIIGYSELAQNDLDREHPVSKHVEQIKKAGQRAASLTRQLLAFSRKQVLQTRALNLNGIVNSVSKMLCRLIGEDISLVLRLAEPLSSVRVDLGQMEQVLMNLAVNARDAMPEGGRIFVETADVELDEVYSQGHRVVKPGPYVMLSVSDTGVGMDQATLSRIFEPFFTTKEPGRGTGLGLSTVYGIVKQSGGYIWVYSELFRGTTVKIYLPPSDQPAESLLPPAAKVVLPTGTETILLVEDDEALRKVTISLLQSGGYKMLEADNAVSAINISDRFDGNIDLLLSDVILPGKSGPDLALEIKRNRPNIKFLYASGYTGDMIAHQGVLDPGTTLLSKPFSKETLLTTVREVLDKGMQPPPSIDTFCRGLARDHSQLALNELRNSRRHLRFKLNVDATVHSSTQGHVLANTLDISESGLSAILPIELPLGEIVELDFQLPILRVRVVASVREHYRLRYGFEFVEPDDATLRTIRESCALLEKLGA
jgi:two-component system cell cycle sensor histidine kinase/response regulator CckA